MIIEFLLLLCLFVILLIALYKYLTFGSESKSKINTFFYSLSRLSILLNQHKIQTTNINLKYKDLKEELNGVKIVQISDLHYSNWWLYKYNNKIIEKAVEMINKLSPDIVIITGDIIASFSKENINGVCKILSKIKCEKKYACLGNHDVLHPLKVTKKVIKDELKKNCNFMVIDNDVEYIFDGKMRILGFGSLMKRDFKIFKIKEVELQEEKFTLALTHNPDTYFKLRDFKPKIDLICAGHTHGGQICFPFIKIPVVLISYELLKFFKCRIPKIVQSTKYVVKDWNLFQGLYKFYQNQFLYVNRGIGSHLAIRYFCRPEISVFTIKNII